MKRLASLVPFVCLGLFVAPVGCSDDSPGDTSGTDSSTGDGDGDGSESGGMEAGDGDPTTGDGDPTTGDGDPTTGDGDPTGDGDGDPAGDGDGDPGTMCPGLGANNLIFHTTLDDQPSVANPAVGAGGTVTTMPADDFVPALSGNGVQLDAAGERVEVPETTNTGPNIDMRQGTIDFCYQPNFNHTDGGEHVLFATSDNGNGFLLARISGSNDDSIHMLLVVNGMVWEKQISGMDYAMNAGEWYRLTFAWDFINVGNNETNMHIYLDGVEMQAATFDSFGPAPAPSPDPQGRLWIGARANPNQPPLVADGIIDDFKVYDQALVP